MLQRVKCVTDRDGYALYFSRGAIPCNKDGAVRAFPAPFADRPYLLHLGIVCLDADFLQQYATMPATPLMQMEDLEQLKVRAPPLCERAGLVVRIWLCVNSSVNFIQCVHRPATSGEVARSED